MPTQTPDSVLGDLPLLVLVAAGERRYREYLLASIRRQYRIHLIAMVAPTWELPYLVGHTVLADLGTDVTVAAVGRIAGRQPVAGVLSWDESKILQTAAAAGRLGLPGGQPEAVLRCRDKFRTRQALDAAGVPQPAYELVGDVESALAAAARIGYPVVLKPRAASASFGVVLVTSASELAAHFTYPRDTTVPHMPRFESEVLVEEYLPDPEISIDAAVYRGQVMPAFLARKDVGFQPYFEETGHYVSHFDPLLHDPEFAATLQATHEALGFRDGWTHTEYKITAAGPKLIEVNGRLGGDLIPYLGMRASGIDPGLVAAAVACGQRPNLVPTRELACAVRFFYVTRDHTVIDSVGFDEDALPPGIDLAVALAQPGDVVSPPPTGIVSGRVAFATVTGRTRAECAETLDGAQRALRLRTAPAPPPVSAHRVQSARDRAGQREVSPMEEQAAPHRGPAERVLLVSLMKSGTHLIQELIVALGYGVYGSSRIPPEIRPVLDDDTLRRMACMVYDEETFGQLAEAGGSTLREAGMKAWEALGWAWQLRLGMPLESRYGAELTNAGLIQQALRRTARSAFAETPANVCWVATELDIKKVEGGFLTEWSATGEPRIIFMYRDPRDITLSMVNFLSGRTAQGYGNYSEFHVFNRILTAKPSLADKLTYALTDPAFPGVDDYERSLWLLHDPNICKVTFEELVGPRGGGSAAAQQAAVARIVDFLGLGADTQEIASRLFRRDSFTFYKGQIGSWREAFGPEHKAMLASRLGPAIEQYGYAS